jgi:hypothetical protein
VGSVIALVPRAMRRRVGYSHFFESVICIILLTTVFVCVAALAILDKLDEVDHQTLSWWLAERQLPNGGLNGRPEKLEDVRFPFSLFCHVLLFMLMIQVCYSFWVLSSLSILNKLTWIDAEKLISFILSAQVCGKVLLWFQIPTNSCF